MDQRGKRQKRYALIDAVELGPLIEEPVDADQRSTRGCLVKRSVFLIVSMIDVCSLADERAEDVREKRMVCHARNVMQRGGVVGCDAGRISASLYQELAELEMSCRGRTMQWGPVFVVVKVDVVFLL